MSKLGLYLKIGMGLAIAVLVAMNVMKDARIDTLGARIEALDVTVAERDGTIQRQTLQAQRMAGALKIEQIRGDVARSQVAAGDAAVKAGNAREAKLHASLIEARKEIANAPASDDAPAAPVLVRAYERMFDFAETYRALRAGDGFVSGDGKAAPPAGAAAAAGSPLGAGLTQRHIADACVGTAQALGSVAAQLISLRDDFEPAYNANVDDFNVRAKALALEGARFK